MTVGLDTSVVLRLLVGEPAEQALIAWDALSVQPAGAVLISDLVVSETYFALRHHYRVPHGEALAAIAAFLVDPRVHATGVAPAVLATSRSVRGDPGFMDRLIHADYGREDAALLTFDRAAATLDGAHLLAD